LCGFLNLLKNIIDKKRINRNLVINFLKQIFTWWHKQTVGTFIYTVFTGRFAGEDQFGNKYYSNSRGRRWVIYKNNIESSKIPPEWHSWVHFLTRNTPSDNNKKIFMAKRTSRKSNRYKKST